MEQPLLSSPNNNNSPNQYEPFKIPPDKFLLNKHYRCSQFGIDADDQNLLPCPCCSQKQKVQLGISCTVKDIANVSFSMGYYFKFLRNLMCYCFLLFLVNGIYNYVELIQYCQQDKCFYIYGMPFKRLSTFFNPEHQILDLTTLVVISLFMFYSTYVYLDLYKLRLDSTKASDYTILVSGVDHYKISETDIKRFYKEEGIEDVQVLYTHKIGTYIKAERKKCILKSQLQYYRVNERRSISKYQLTLAKLKELEQEMLPTLNKFYFNQQHDLRTDKIFVTFTSSQLKDIFCKKYAQRSTLKRIYMTFCNTSDFRINNSELFIEEIAQPNQILWENLEVFSSQRYIRVFISNTASIVLLIISFLLVVQISAVQLRTSAENQYYSYICAGIIMLINLILSYVIEYFVKKQKRYTATGVTASILVKQCITMFLNTTLIPFSMFFLFKQKQSSEQDLIQNTIVIFYVNALLNPLLMFVNLKSFYRHFKRKTILNKHSQCILTQNQAHQIFQKVDFQVGFKYALINKMVMMATFYGSIFPLGLLIAMLGFFLTYWVSKYMLLRHSCLPNISYKMSRCVNQILYNLPIIYSLGVITNEYLVLLQVRITSLCILLVAVVLSILSHLYFEYIIKKCLLGGIKLIPKPKRIKAITELGIVDYKNLNPTSFQNKKYSEINYRSDENPFVNCLNLYASAIEEQ